MNTIAERVFEAHHPTYEMTGGTSQRTKVCSCGKELLSPGETLFAWHLIAETELLVQEDIATEIERHRDQVTASSGGSNADVMIRMALDVATRISRRLE